jgi:hypothetical protein
MSAPHLFLAFTNPSVGREAEFNEWYDRVHVPDVLGAPGWLAAQRYRLCGEQRPDQSPIWRYLVTYEVDLPEGQIFDSLKLRPDVGPEGQPDPPLWADDSQVWVYSQVGPRQERKS